MVPDVSTGDPMRSLCLNCARRAVSPRTYSKFERLKGYLQFRGSFTTKVKLAFARIDGILGENLPMEAYKTEQWWTNAPSEHSKGWLEAGWEVEVVNLKEGFVVFKKVRTVRVKHKKTEIKPFTPVPVRIPKPKTPSKTKVSKLYARIKNIERQKTVMPRYRGSFKPKPKYEKTLFRSDEKPS